MADVFGYEEKEDRVVRALDSGYPRFVVHHFIRKLIEHHLKHKRLEAQAAVLIPGKRAVEDLKDYVARREAPRSFVPLSVSEVKEADDPLFLVSFNADSSELKGRVQKFMQHTGCGISSRQAEDLLFACGLKESVYEEEAVSGECVREDVEHTLSQLIGCRPEDVFVCASGMNAFYTGFRAVRQVQSARGRTRWLQLGWLYLDSGCVLKEFLEEGDSSEYCYDATDLEDIIQKIQACGDSLACVVIECPTNPLLQVPDLPQIAKATRKAGGLLLVDPTVTSIYNVEVLPYADVLVTSLTKYAAYRGDVMIGALALNPDSADREVLATHISGLYQPPYSRDLARLGFQMKTAPKVVAIMEANARKLADYLQAHDAVKKVHYAGYSEKFSKVAGTPDSGGAVLTIELKNEIGPFYDSLAVMKGPGFGTEFTLACPFMFLAHYDLVTSDEGRRFLRSIGIDPSLVRISVGVEPIEAIIQAFDRALNANCPNQHKRNSFRMNEFKPAGL